MLIDQHIDARLEKAMNGVQLQQEFQVILREGERRARKIEMERQHSESRAENVQLNQVSETNSTNGLRVLLSRLRFSKPMRANPAAR